jgi:DsbC/DsbD-like thiol-disulfide interchange protein
MMSRAAPAALAALACLVQPVFAQEASPWAEGIHSRARLVAGKNDGHRRWAGIEVSLDRGFKTYWRHPGEAGLPPRFDWTGSENAASIDLRWPAPARTEDAGGVAYSYSDRVVFPVSVEAKDPSKPVSLRVQMEYGVCKTICIPAQAEMTLTLSGGAPHQALIEQALARVPQVQPLGAAGPLAVLAVTPLPGDKPSFEVEVRAPEGASLFAEPPEDWYLSTSPAAAGRFTLTVEERPKSAKGPIPVVLTLAAGPQAVETRVTLDPNPSRP